MKILRIKKCWTFTVVVQDLLADVCNYPDNYWAKQFKFRLLKKKGRNILFITKTGILLEEQQIFREQKEKFSNECP